MPNHGKPEVEVHEIAASGLRSVAGLLEEFLRGGEPLPEEFLSSVGVYVERGEIAVFGACSVEEARYVGVLTLYVRPSFALGGEFASIEDLYVEPGQRGAGIGAAMIEAAEDYCRRRDISYVEVQVEGSGAERFYRAVGYGVEEVRVMSRSQAVGGDFGSSKTS